MKIDVLSNSSLNVLLFNAMASKTESSDGDILEVFGMEIGNSTADVVVTVNGVEVDLVKEVAAHVDFVVNGLESFVEKRALQLLQERASNITSILSEIENNSWKLEQVLKSI